MFQQYPPLFSESHIVIPDNYWQSLDAHLSRSRQKSLSTPLLGTTLQQAALISPQQLKLALTEQQHHTDLKIGEILALHGWILQETADFFAQKWLDLLNSPRYYPIGYYLQQAYLLSEQQIKRILKEQKRMNLLFGELAVLDGFLKPQTRDFFVKNIPDKKVSQPKEVKKQKEVKKPKEVNDAQSNDLIMTLAQKVIDTTPKNLLMQVVEEDDTPLIG